MLRKTQNRRIEERQRREKASRKRGIAGCRRKEIFFFFASLIPPIHLSHILSRPCSPHAPLMTFPCSSYHAFFTPMFMPYSPQAFSLYTVSCTHLFSYKDHNPCFVLHHSPCLCHHVTLAFTPTFIPMQPIFLTPSSPTEVYGSRGDFLPSRVA